MLPTLWNGCGLGSLGAAHWKSVLVWQPRAWIPAVEARQNQAINEMYCFGPPCPVLGEGKKLYCVSH